MRACMRTCMCMCTSRLAMTCTKTHAHLCSVGLKGVDPANQDKVEELVLSKLTELQKTGFSSTSIEAAVNSIEFRYGRPAAHLQLIVSHFSSLFVYGRSW